MSSERTALGDSLSSLSVLRQQIAAVDQQLLTLLAERQGLVRQVGHYKSQRLLPYYDPCREQQLLQTLIASGQQQQLAAQYIAQLFQVIFRHSLALQQQLSTAPPVPAHDNKNPPGVNAHTSGGLSPSHPPTQATRAQCE